MSSHTVTSYTDLKGALQSLLTRPGPHYVVFSSDLDADTGKPWCPDCIRALPPIKDAMRETGASLLEVRVGSRAVWKDPAHPLRHDPAFAVSGVPTLVRYTPSGPTARLGRELEDEATTAEVLKLTKDFIDATNGAS